MISNKKELLPRLSGDFKVINDMGKPNCFKPCIDCNVAFKVVAAGWLEQVFTAVIFF